MTDYIESVVGKDGKILIEVTDNKGKVGFGSSVVGTKEEKKVDNTFNQALNTIRLAATSVMETLNTLEEKPNHVKLDFAIKIDADAGAMLARADSRDSQLKVSLSWQTPPAKEDKEDKEENEA